MTGLSAFLFDVALALVTLGGTATIRRTARRGGSGRSCGTAAQAQHHVLRVVRAGTATGRDARPLLVHLDRPVVVEQRGDRRGPDVVVRVEAALARLLLVHPGVALERAAGHARDAGVDVRWVHAALTETALPPASYDLVSAQYPALLRTADGSAERALLSAVAVGGVLLLVHHAGMDTREANDNGFDPADYVWPSMVAALIDDDWVIEVDEERPRVVPDGGAGAHHTDDVVLRARRLR